MSDLYTPNSRVRLPTAERSGFLYDLLDAEGNIAYLRIAHLTRYGEAMEMETGGPVPQLHSATETFRAMVVEMEEASPEADQPAYNVNTQMRWPWRPLGC
jgi:hypothetical protein